MHDDEFGQLAATYQAELRAHCYRILGSVHDAEDALQAELAAPLTELPWLEPYPDQWLAPGSEPSPEARYEQRESVELAFVAAIQHLPPRQRAVLLLREVAGFSAAEIAGLLGTSAASVTSALQRARGGAHPAASPEPAGHVARARRPAHPGTRPALRGRDGERRHPGPGRPAHPGRDLVDAARPDLVPRARPVRDFLARYPLTDRWKHRPVRASGQLAVAGYVYDDDTGGFIPASIDVLTLDGDKIAAVTGFLTADLLGPGQAGRWVSGAELFSRFGVPAGPP